MVVLSSQRLLFREHEPGDLAAFCEMESDPEYRHPDVVHSLSELERSFREAWMRKKRLGLLATVLKESGLYIGRSGLYPRRDEGGNEIADEAEIAFYLARPYWGRGLATEAARTFVDYGFGRLGLKRIYAGINVLNGASIRVVQKVGFTLIRSGEGGGSRWQEFAIDNPDGSANEL